MSRLATSLLGLVLFGTCGCASHVEWRADSQVVYYSHADGRILEYDLAMKSSRAIARIDVGTKGQPFPNFDLRPDGGRIVVAESNSVGNDTTLVLTKLRIVDLDGKTEKNATLEWPAVRDEQNEPEPIATFVEWSPTARHVLVATEQSIALWDVENDSIRTHETVRPVLPMYMGASPWRPDGSGLLALGKGHEPDSLDYVGIDGTVEPIDVGNAFREKAGNPAAKNDFRRGTWNGSTLTTTVGNRRVTIDTASRTAKSETVEASPVHEYSLGEAKLRFDTSGEKPRLDWVRGDRTISLGESFGPTYTLPNGPVVVAPDGRRAIVVREQDVVLVDETGIVATLPTTPVQ